jgi:asparagine N-glycosylation enzyme membrane subunit Stt3
VRTGEGVLDSVWHTYNMMASFTPSVLPAMRAARQQKGELDFSAVNRVHVPVALASLVLLIATIVLAIKQERFADLGPLAATAALAIMANAAVCGVLANPHDRYGARLVWLAAFVIALVPWRAVAPSVIKSVKKHDASAVDARRA